LRLDNVRREAIVLVRAHAAVAEGHGVGFNVREPVLVRAIIGRVGILFFHLPLRVEVIEGLLGGRAWVAHGLLPFIARGWRTMLCVHAPIFCAILKTAPARRLGVERLAVALGRVSGLKGPLSPRLAVPERLVHEGEFEPHGLVDLASERLGLEVESGDDLAGRRGVLYIEVRFVIVQLAARVLQGIVDGFILGFGHGLGSFQPTGA